MSSVFKQAIMQPLIKKPKSVPVFLKNYRPVSRISYISRVIKEAASQQIAGHIEKNSLADPLESATS